MIIKYYKDNDLKYAGRKRFKDISSYTPLYEEEQRSVLINDGATCTVKTSSSNICDYVTIDDTRWFVTSYVYLNGGQVELYLQRDVIGEFGIEDIYAKIERGYTDTVLRNRKELNLNEVLKERKMLMPSTDTYGNYSVSTHDNELWGILYFNKPEEDIPVNIPGYGPPVMDYPVLENNSKKLNSTSNISRIQFHAGVSISGRSRIYLWVGMLRVPEYGEDGKIVSWVNQFYSENAPSNPLTIFDIELTEGVDYPAADLSRAKGFLYGILKKSVSPNGIFVSNPTGITYENIEYDYNNAVIKSGSTFYKYTGENTYENSNGNIGDADAYFTGRVGKETYDENNFYKYKLNYYECASPSTVFNTYGLSNYIRYNITNYTRVELNPSESGSINISSQSPIVDEPYSVLIFPLYDVTITNTSDNISYIIERRNAFFVFNNIIKRLSGENGLLIDAQVYPYCPNLVSISSVLTDAENVERSYPLFLLESNTYNHFVDINLDANDDVKKEYIQRKYIISSPEQSGTFEFNFYDYKVKNTDLNIVIKTALKPFAIITSAVITPDNDSIKGMAIKGITFSDDMRGCNPSSNGFECSLSSNAFETYKRQNANYQQIFALQKEELALQHATELVNEQTSRTVNTLSAGAMGAIGGAATGQAIGGRIGAGIGAGIAGAAAGTITNIAMNKQIEQNEELREFERDLQSQMFNLNIGTIKALPNSVNRISSFNEILLNNFWYRIEVYECTEEEKELVDDFIEKYGYGLGVYGYLDKYHTNNWFLRGNIITSLFPVNLANIASNELKGGIYYND